MSKLNERLTLIANLSVVAGVIFLATEMRQNTRAIQAQTRDAVTEKQMEYLGWLATSPELAAALVQSDTTKYDSLTSEARLHLIGYTIGQLREWENSFYQYENGLFGEEEIDARRSVWRNFLSRTAGAATNREIWGNYREGFTPRFRAEIDRLVAEAEGGAAPR